MLLSGLFTHLIVRGRLTVIDAAGRAHVFGPDPEPAITVRLHDRASELRILLSPELGVAEAYMNGRLTVEDGSLYDFLHFAATNLAQAGPNGLMRARARIGHLVRRLMQHNPIPRARRNAAHHYDLSGELYDLFLDSDHQYSCGYFAAPEDDLERAQERKKRHLAAKLLLAPGHKVLDIGSGWGGLALYLAEKAGADVTGVTLSTEQHKVSTERAEARKLDHKVRFHLRDYREESGRYDRIVSVGMFEHVGVGHYREFFAKLRDLLTPDGVALLHTIGRADGPGSTGPFIRKYIFPGGYAPALSEVLPAIESAGLFVTDIEVLRLHYAETLRAWRARFLANRERAKALYDERFCRMWEFYLAGSEVSFRCLGMVVFQIQMARAQDAVPLTRDYLIDDARAGAARPSRAA